jgi:CheY-like chemotaxis protein
VLLQLHDGGESVDVLQQTVLIVDDDPDMRLYLRTCLRGLASPFERVIEAADGLEALRLVQSGTVRLVISDVWLPGLDGRQLCRAIRDDAALRHVFVLLISGDGAVNEKTADGFLLKPFNSRQLLAALDGMLPRQPA